MLEDLKYVQYLEKDVDDLKSQIEIEMADDDVSFYTLFRAFGKHLEEKHVTWARFGKKLDKNTTFQAGDSHPDTFTKCA
ncbi:hypothetical protein Tco_0143742 [Tanacetum coccineum]